MADGVQVTVRSNLAEIQKLLAIFPTEILPDGVGVAFRELGTKMVRAGRARLDERFEIRSPWVRTSWTAVAGATMDDSPVTRADGSPVRGVVKDFKRAWPNPVLTVGHRDYYMELQEVGGIKRTTYDPERGQEGFVAIPSRLAWALRDSRGRVPKSLRHYDLLQRDAARINETPMLGRAVQLRRTTQVRGRRKLAVNVLLQQTGPARVTQLIRDFARIKPRAGMFERAQQVADASLIEELHAGLEQATEYASRKLDLKVASSLSRSLRPML